MSSYWHSSVSYTCSILENVKPPNMPYWRKHNRHYAIKLTMMKSDSAAPKNSFVFVALLEAFAFFARALSFSSFSRFYSAIYFLIWTFCVCLGTIKRKVIKKNCLLIFFFLFLDRIWICFCYYSTQWYMFKIYVAACFFLFNALVNVLGASMLLNLITLCLNSSVLIEFSFLSINVKHFSRR